MPLPVACCLRSVPTAHNCGPFSCIIKVECSPMHHKTQAALPPLALVCRGVARRHAWMQGLQHANGYALAKDASVQQTYGGCGQGKTPCRELGEAASGQRRRAQLSWQTTINIPLDLATNLAFHFSLFLLPPHPLAHPHLRTHTPPFLPLPTAAPFPLPCFPAPGASSCIFQKYRIPPSWPLCNYTTTPFTHPN